MALASPRKLVFFYYGIILERKKKKHRVAANIPPATGYVAHTTEDPDDHEYGRR